MNYIGEHLLPGELGRIATYIAFASALAEPIPFFGSADRARRSFVSWALGLPHTWPFCLHPGGPSFSICFSDII